MKEDEGNEKKMEKGMKMLLKTKFIDLNGHEHEIFTK